MRLEAEKIRQRIEVISQILTEFEDAYFELGAAMDARRITDDGLVMGARQHAAGERYSRIHCKLEYHIRNLGVEVAE